ncbi:hypothetical protein P4O66_010342, partial [Electrophorus voltai]
MQQESYPSRGLLVGAKYLALLPGDTDQAWEDKRRATHTFDDMMDTFLGRNTASMGNARFTCFAQELEKLLQEGEAETAPALIGTLHPYLEEEGQPEGLTEDPGDSGSDTMVVDEPSLDQEVESYEGQEFHYDSCSEAGSEHTFSSHHSMELPLEALSDVESEYSVDSCMEVEASPIPNPTKGAHHSKVHARPHRSSGKVQVSSGTRRPRVYAAPHKFIRTVRFPTAPEPVAGGSSGEPWQKVLPGKCVRKAGVPSSPKQTTPSQPAMGGKASTPLWSAMGILPALPLGNISYVPVTVTTQWSSPLSCPHWPVSAALLMLARGGVPGPPWSPFGVGLGVVAQWAGALGVTPLRRGSVT